MNHAAHNKLISFIWSIADDCLRDVYVRGKYRDVILPMVVLRRLDTLLEPTKEAVLDEVQYQKDEMQATDLDEEPLKDASGYVFYNVSKWTLTSLHNTATNNRQILLANFEEYLNGFSANVQEIIERFELKGKIQHMANKDVLLEVVEKFVSPKINLTPVDAVDPDGYKLPALSNLGMGYVFEELIRKFNEEERSTWALMDGFNASFLLLCFVFEVYLQKGIHSVEVPATHPEVAPASTGAVDNPTDWDVLFGRKYTWHHSDQPILASLSGGCSLPTAFYCMLS